MKTTPNHYETLHLGRNASLSEIRIAYRNLAKIHHPDVGGKKEDFQIIVEAYEVLSDPIKKSEYDKSLDWQDSQTFESESGSQNNPYKANTNSQKTYEYEYPYNQYSYQVVQIVNRLNSYYQINDAINEILPLMRILAAQSVDKNQFIRFSSGIALALMNIVIVDANGMVQDFHSHINIDKEGIKSAYKSFCRIGLLKMDDETKETFTSNKKEIGKTVHSLTVETINNAARIVAILIYIAFVFLFARTGKVNLYSSITLILISDYLYKLIHFTIYLILKTIESIVWNIKILFN